MELINNRHPQIRVSKNVLTALKEYARRMEQDSGTRFSMSAFASSAILKALDKSVCVQMLVEREYLSTLPNPSTPEKDKEHA